MYKDIYSFFIFTYEKIDITIPRATIKVIKFFFPYPVFIDFKSHTSICTNCKEVIDLSTKENDVLVSFASTQIGHL